MSYGTMIDRIEDERRTRKRTSEAGTFDPTVLEYFDALELTKPYWEAHKRVLSGQELELYQKLFVNASPQIRENIKAGLRRELPERPRQATGRASGGHLPDRDGGLDSGEPDLADPDCL